MAGYSSVFKRVEKKYRIGAAERAAVEAAASGLMAVDAYGRSRITSLYLDTPERAMIARSVEKPLHKEKLRLRAYGEADGAALTLPASLAFVSGLPYEQACARWPLADEAATRAALSSATRQIARELEAAMDRNLPLAPSMGIACDREAWGFRPAALVDHADDALFDAELRITFDDCLEYFDCHRTGSAPSDSGSGGSGWLPILEPSESIMEIKNAGPYPAWLVAALSAHSIYPGSFTKYGNAYQLCSSAQEKFVADFAQKRVC